MSHFLNPKNVGEDILSYRIGNPSLDVDMLNQGGEGLIGSVGSFLKRNTVGRVWESGPPGFGGEKHQILRLDNGKFGRANFSGPGTNIIKRLRRGDKPRSAVVDRAARVHDIEYAVIANAPKDKQAKLVRVADNRMINTLRKGRARGIGSRANIVPALAALTAKKKGEDMGVISATKFISKTPLNSADLRYLKGQLDKRKDEGFSGEGLKDINKGPGERLRQKMGKGINFPRGEKQEGKGLNLPTPFPFGGGGKKKSSGLRGISSFLKKNLLPAIAKTAGVKSIGRIVKQILPFAKEAVNSSTSIADLAKKLAHKYGNILIENLHGRSKRSQLGRGELSKTAKKRLFASIGAMLKRELKSAQKQIGSGCKIKDVCVKPVRMAAFRRTACKCFGKDVIGN